MESFNKRQKEMRRLERQRDKAAKRKEVKARKAAETASGPNRNIEFTENAGAGDPGADLAVTE